MSNLVSISDKDVTQYDKLIEKLLEELGISYASFGWIWRDKFIWIKHAWNEFDKLGMCKLLSNSLSNAVFGNGIKIWTPNDAINDLLDEDLMGRLNFNSKIVEHFKHCCISGDMLMSITRDPYDKQLSISYIQGNNIIFTSYNGNGDINEVAWFTREWINGKSYIILCKEDMYQRAYFMYKYEDDSLTPINFGQNEWIYAFGKDTLIKRFKDRTDDKGNSYQTSYGVEIFGQDSQFRHFAAVSTGLKDEKWKYVPYHNSILEPVIELDRFYHDWDAYNKEVDYSEKAVFVDTDIMDSTDQDRARCGIESLTAEQRRLGGFYKFFALGNKQAIDDYTPPIRSADYYNKLAFDLKMICVSRGFDSNFLQLDLPPKEMTAEETILSNKKTRGMVKAIKDNLIPAVRQIVWALINEYHNEGTITDKDFADLQGISSIEISMDESFFINWEKNVNLYLQIMGMPAPNGGRLIDWETFLVDGMKLSKEHAIDIIEKAIEEKNNLDNSDIEKQLLMNGIQIPQQKNQEESKEK